MVGCWKIQDKPLDSFLLLNITNLQEWETLTGQSDGLPFIHSSHPIMGYVVTQIDHLKGSPGMGVGHSYDLIQEILLSQAT